MACKESEYEAQLAVKVQKLESLMATATSNPLPAVEVHDSPKTHFRMRANFNIWRDAPSKKNGRNSKANEDEDFYYAMFEPEAAKRQAAEITSFPRGSLFLNVLMDMLMKVLKMPEYKPLNSSLFEVRFVCTQTEQAVIVLLYRMPLPSKWRDLAISSMQHLPQGKVLKIIGRSLKIKEVVTNKSKPSSGNSAYSSTSTPVGEDDIIEEVYTIQPKSLNRRMTVYQTEGAFSQPNATVCEKMLTWACDLTAAQCAFFTDENSREFQARDLLELYCGGGTFTTALAMNFRNVLATEQSKQSVELAEMCFTKNRNSNVKVARLSSEEFEQAMNGGRTSGEGFKRLEKKKIDLKTYDFSTVFVDPPRAGLDDKTCKLLTRFDHIIYISCNPETLARDLKVIFGTGTYTLERLAAFDQFPYTHHLECGVYLKKTEIARQQAKEGVLDQLAAFVAENVDEVRVPEASTEQPAAVAAVEGAEAAAAVEVTAVAVTEAGVNPAAPPAASGDAMEAAQDSALGKRKDRGDVYEADLVL